METKVIPLITPEPEGNERPMPIGWINGSDKVALVKAVKAAGYTVMPGDFQEELEDISAFIKGWKSKVAEFIVEPEPQKVKITLTDSIADGQLEAAIQEAFDRFGPYMLLDFLQTYLSYFADENKG